MEYDYVIIGSGAGGSVLANRLSADPEVSVLVLEAGGKDSDLIHLVPKGFYFTSSHKKYAKGYDTEESGEGAHEHWHRGRVLGGSTTANGMIWNRGWAPDYDAYESLGLTGWNWARFLEAYRALENHELGGTYFRGDSGPIGVTLARPREPVSDMLIEAMAKHGISFADDMNASDLDRVAYTASSIKHGLRVSASRALLRAARRRSNLTVVTHTEVDRILFEGTRAVGVSAIQNQNTSVTFRANREVLLCGGTFESPMLLERSGVGQPDLLRQHGIPVIADSPRVGEGLREHRGILFQFELTGVKGFNQQISSTARQMWAGFKYLFTRSGLIAHGAFGLAAMYASDPTSERPDTQIFFTPVSTSEVNPMTGRLVVDKKPGARLVSLGLRPTSEGSIHITGRSLLDPPKLIPNFLATEHDRQLLIAGFRKARDIVASAPLSEHIAKELQPGPDIQTDQDILRYGLNKGNAGYHTLGTCAMGPEDSAVVDGRLRVRGTTGLRVVDASVLRWQPSGNSAAPTMALAWIAADLITEDASPGGAK